MCFRVKQQHQEPFTVWHYVITFIPKKILPMERFRNCGSFGQLGAFCGTPLLSFYSDVLVLVLKGSPVAWTSFIEAEG